jgi:hypothetical protein
MNAPVQLTNAAATLMKLNKQQRGPHKTQPLPTKEAQIEVFRMTIQLPSQQR